MPQTCHVASCGRLSRSSLETLMETLCPSEGLHLHCPSTSHEPHFLMPSFLGTRFSTVCGVGEHKHSDLLNDPEISPYLEYRKDYK